MPNITRAPLLAVSLCFLLSTQVYSQFSLSVTGGLRNSVQKVLDAYKNQYMPIQGDTLSVTKEALIFDSKVKPDAESLCTITHFLEPEQVVYTWEAMILRTENFNTATKKYNACCMQLKGITANMGAGHCRFESDYEPANTNKSFYSTLFTPTTSVEPYSKLRLEVLLEADVTEWVVKVLVYDNERKSTDGNLGVR